MATQVRELMTQDPIVLEATESVRTAARKMQEADVGAVLVEESGTLRGIVTDRDLVTRVIAAETDAEKISVGQVASSELVTLSPDDTLADAVTVMREHAIRRIPVVEDSAAVGILSIGDLAVARDPESALADISAAEPNA
jgi:CBS domain-containing protein